MQLPCLVMLPSKIPASPYRKKYETDPAVKRLKRCRLLLWTLTGWTPRMYRYVIANTENDITMLENSKKKCHVKKKSGTKYLVYVQHENI
jgi:hypothetical protein